MVIRFGGEEFVVILHNTKLYEAFNIAERIRQTIEEMNIRIIKTKITASFGVAEAGDNDTEEELLKELTNFCTRRKVMEGIFAAVLKNMIPANPIRRSIKLNVLEGKKAGKTLPKL